MHDLNFNLITFLFFIKRLLAAKIADLQERLAGPTDDKNACSTFSPSQILLGGYSSAQVDQDHDEKLLHKFNCDPITLSPAASSGFLRNSTPSESTKSMASHGTSECEKQSAISDVSSEYTMDTVNETTEDKRDKECNGDASTELQDLPKEIQEMVQMAMSKLY